MNTQTPGQITANSYTTLRNSLVDVGLNGIRAIEHYREAASAARRAGDHEAVRKWKAQIERTEQLLQTLNAWQAVR